MATPLHQAQGLALEGKKVALFVAPFFEDLELWYPYYRLKEAGADVVIVGPKVQAYKGKHGLEAEAQQAIFAVKTEEYHGLIIPGGYSPDHMRRVPEMVNFVRQMHEEKKTIAAICHAPWMLASAGIVRGKRLTSFPSIKDDLINAGAEWSDQEVVCDGNLITSRSPDDLPAFCRALIAALC